jgi:hypothetical protein
LRGGLAAFIDYVAENPDNYTSLVRGAASGDADLRAIFDETRSALAGRVMTVLGELGPPLGARAELAVHGWVAFTEECCVRSLGGRMRDRDALLDLLTRALPALLLAAGDDDDAGALVAALGENQAIASK